MEKMSREGSSSDLDHQRWFVDEGLKNEPRVLIAVPISVRDSLHALKQHRKVPLYFVIKQLLEEHRRLQP